MWQTSAPARERGRVYAQPLIDGEPISFLIEERFRESPREPNARELAREKREYRYHAPRTESIPTGALRIVRIDSTCRWFARRKSWFDQGKRRVESKIPRILAAFHERAVEIKAQRAKEERKERERLERERLLEEEAERRQAHANLIAELERQAGAWHRARFLRRYIHAAYRTLQGESVHAKFRGERINFLDWATAYVNQLDPLSLAPTNPDQGPEPTDYPGPDESGLKKLLLRVMGFDGRPHSKITTLGDVAIEHDEEEQ